MIYLNMDKMHLRVYIDFQQYVFLPMSSKKIALDVWNNTVCLTAELSLPWTLSKKKV